MSDQPTGQEGRQKFWECEKVLACFRCGPVPRDQASPCAEDEDIMIHNSRMLPRVEHRSGHEGYCGQEVCWTWVVPAPSDLLALQEENRRLRDQLDPRCDGAHSSRGRCVLRESHESSCLYEKDAADGPPASASALGSPDGENSNDAKEQR